MDYLLAAIGFALRVLLLARGTHIRIWRHYPVFCAFLLYSLLRSVAIVLMAHSGSPLYASAYWVTEFLSFAFLFCVAFELFRRIFPPSSALHWPAGSMGIVVLAVVAAVFYFGSARPGNLTIPDVLRKSGTALACWLLSMLVVARYYGQRLGRNALGIATGVGLMISVWVINLSAFGLDSSYFLLLRYIGPLSVIAVYALWTWSLWYYAPSTPFGSGRDNPPAESVLVGWQESWRKVEHTLKKVLER